MMRGLKPVFTALPVVFLLTAPVWAATRTATLDVPGMTCAACPLTVKTALSRVPGVIKVEVLYKKKQAVVVYDDAKTNVHTLVKATTDAGYPSTPEKASNP